MNFDFQNSSNANSGIYFISGKSECSGLCQLNDCYNMFFPKVIVKSVFILVQCNTSLSKNYVAHLYVTVVCVIG